MPGCLSNIPEHLFQLKAGKRVREVIHSHVLGTHMHELWENSYNT